MYECSGGYTSKPPATVNLTAREILNRPEIRDVRKIGMNLLKGQSHQIRSAWKWYGRIDLGRDMRRWTF